MPPKPRGRPKKAASPAVKAESSAPAVKAESPAPAVKAESPAPAVKAESPAPAPVTTRVTRGQAQAQGGSPTAGAVKATPIPGPARRRPGRPRKTPVAVKEESENECKANIPENTSDDGYDKVDEEEDELARPTTINPSIRRTRGRPPTAKKPAGSTAKPANADSTAKPDESTAKPDESTAKPKEAGSDNVDEDEDELAQPIFNPPVKRGRPVSTVIDRRKRVRPNKRRAPKNPPPPTGARRNTIVPLVHYSAGDMDGEADGPEEAVASTYGHPITEQDNFDHAVPGPSAPSLPIAPPPPMRPAMPMNMDEEANAFTYGYKITEQDVVDGIVPNVPSSPAPKRGRGRPPKTQAPTRAAPPAKRGPGRPRKTPLLDADDDVNSDIAEEDTKQEDADDAEEAVASRYGEKITKQEDNDAVPDAPSPPAPKRGRGRPPKINNTLAPVKAAPAPKRGPGRPRKTPLPKADEEFDDDIDSEDAIDAANTSANTANKAKRGRGRPPKTLKRSSSPTAITAPTAKRGPGRPRKAPLPEADEEVSDDIDSEDAITLANTSASTANKAKRGRGRPPKTLKRSISPTVITAPPAKRGPGRPRKAPLPEADEADEVKKEEEGEKGVKEEEGEEEVKEEDEVKEEEMEL